MSGYIEEICEWGIAVIGFLIIENTAVCMIYLSVINAITVH